jgi:hypothetical protein
MVSNVRALDVLLAEAPDGDGIRRVQKKGIALDGAWFVAPELEIGAEVHVRYDPVDLGRIYVFRVLDGLFICEAICPDRTGVDRSEVAAMSREIRTSVIRKKVAEAKALAKSLKTEDIVHEILAQKAEAAGKLVQLRRAPQEWITDGITQAAEAARFRDTIAKRYGDGATTPDVAAEARVVHLMQDAGRALDTPEARFDRALALLRRLPETREDEDQAWLDSYVATSEFRGRWAVHCDLELGGVQPLPDARRGPFAV